MGEANAQYVILQLALLKTEILNEIEESKRTVVKEELHTFCFEVDERIEKYHNKKPTPMKILMNLRSNKSLKKLKCMVKSINNRDLVMSHAKNLVRCVVPSTNN